MKIRVLLLSAAVVACMSVNASAAFLTSTVGADLPGLPFANGDEVPEATIDANSVAPFDSQSGDDASANFNESWTHDFSSTAGESIVGASLTVGIWGHESHHAGDQVASFTINGIDLATEMNTAFEGNASGEETTYNIYSITLPGSVISSIDSLDSAGLDLQLQPGTGPDDFNGAWILGAQLTVETDAVVQTVPDPSSMLLLSAVGLFGLARRRRKQGAKADLAAEV